MWYIIIGLLLWVESEAVVMHGLITGSITESFIRIAPGELGKKYINFRDPASYGWLIINGIERLSCVITWPLCLLCWLIMLVHYIRTDEDLYETYGLNDCW